MQGQAAHAALSLLLLDIAALTVWPSASLERAQLPDDLAARVFSVVDTYDALTSHRPYKSACTHEAALAELRAQAGQQFDPTAVRLFATLLEAERE